MGHACRRRYSITGHVEEDTALWNMHVEEDTALWDMHVCWGIFYPQNNYHLIYYVFYVYFFLGEMQLLLSLRSSLLSLIHIN